MAYGKIVRGQMREARTLAQEFLELAERHQDALVLAVGHWMLAYTAWWQGDVVEVSTHSRRGLEFYEPDQHLAGIAAYNQNPGIVCGYLDALASWVLGYPTQAVGGHGTDAGARNRTPASLQRRHRPPILRATGSASS